MRLVTEDPQEILDISYKYFKEARSQCRSKRVSTPTCIYENEVGQRCVAGNLMIAETAKDEDALREYLGSARQLAQHVGLEIPGDALNLILSLQTVHDTPQNWDLFGQGRFQAFDRLNTVAGLYDLKVPADA